MPKQGYNLFSKREHNKRVGLYRPCPCGCDLRNDDRARIGYISGSTSDGSGFTIYLESEELYQRVKTVFTEQGLPVTEVVTLYSARMWDGVRWIDVCDKHPDGCPDIVSDSVRL